MKDLEIEEGGIERNNNLREVVVDADANVEKPGQNLERQRSANAERQQRKIVAGFLAGSEREMVGVINSGDVVLPAGAREDVIRKIADGEIGAREEQGFIYGIQDPVQRDGVEAVASRITAKHELRILGVMSAGQEGFYNYHDVGVGNLRDFMRRFPLPMDFEAYSEGFLNDIEKQNGLEKRREYEEAMTGFKSKVYGKKQEYWEQMKELIGEANEWAKSRQRGERAMWAIEYRNGDGAGNIDRTDGAEKEHNSERLVKEIGIMQLSRQQVGAGLATLGDIEEGLQVDNTCEDSILVRPDRQLFGVFDGAGGVRGGREASQLTARVVNELSDRNAPRRGQDLAKILNVANEAVVNSESAGYSTAVLVKITEENGSKMLSWASVGDSRIYIVSKSGEVRLITRDEGEGNRIWNALGMKSEYGEERTEQFGDLYLEDGDRVVMCSDGITGDYGSDLMSNEELGGIVKSAKSAGEAGRMLVAGARKVDDRTAVVVGV